MARIIEYVNFGGHTGLALGALEMRLFKADDVEILVPHRYGVDARQAGSEAQGRRRWTEDEFISVVRQQAAPATAEIIEDPVAWSRQSAEQLFLGNGKQRGL